MQFRLIVLLALAVLAVFVSSVQSTSDADLQKLLSLKDKVSDFLSSANLSPETRASIEKMVEQKQQEIEDNLSRKK